MNFDEYIDVSREFSFANYPRKKLRRVTMEWEDGDLLPILVPDEQDVEEEGELHPVSQQIIDLLAAEEKMTLAPKVLQQRVISKGGARSTYYRCFNQLLKEKVIGKTTSGIVLKKKHLASPE